MFLKSLFLVNQLDIRFTLVAALELLLVELLAHLVNLVVLVLHSVVQVSRLQLQVSVSLAVVVDFLSNIIDFSLVLVHISAKESTLLSLPAIDVLQTQNLLLHIIE